jgi:hypothetical protein
MGVPANRRPPQASGGDQEASALSTRIQSFLTLCLLLPISIPLHPDSHADRLFCCTTPYPSISDLSHYPTSLL